MMKVKWFGYLFLLTIACILFGLNYRFLDFSVLQIYSIDEYAFHKVLVSIYDGFQAIDPKKIFGGFLSYGRIFFALNFIVSLPFIFIENWELVVFLPRLVTAFFALASLYCSYLLVSRLYSHRIASCYLFFLVSVPAFWRNSIWFHPDWMMTSFLLISVYYMALDQYEYGKKFFLSVLFLSLAISIKIQAITFMPFLLLFLYGKGFSICDLSRRFALLVRSLVFMFVVFVITNPYIIHPNGFLAWWGSFLENMVSNATNHGISGSISMLDKFSQVIDSYYLPSGIFAIFCFGLFYVFFSSFKKMRPSIFVCISGYTLINLIYLLIFVNKAWQTYYLPVFFIGYLVLVELCFVFLHDRAWVAIVIFGVINCLYFSAKHKAVFSCGEIHYEPAEFSKLVEVQKSNSDYLCTLLKPLKHRDVQILMSPYTGFRFDQIGLSTRNVQLIYGPISDPNYKEYEVIIIRKDDVYFSSTRLDERVNQDGWNAGVKIVNELIQEKNNYRLYGQNTGLYVFVKDGSL
jgi:hypothetical protein